MHLTVSLKKVAKFYFIIIYLFHYSIIVAPFSLDTLTKDDGPLLISTPPNVTLAHCPLDDFNHPEIAIFFLTTYISHTDVSLTKIGTEVR